MSVFVYDAVDLCDVYHKKNIYVMFSLKCMSSGQKNTTGIIVPFNIVPFNFVLKSNMPHLQHHGTDLCLEAACGSWKACVPSGTWN